MIRTAILNMVVLAWALGFAGRASGQCVEPHYSLSFWAPLDEPTAGNVANIAKPTGPGTDVNGPAIYSGYVSPGNARRYDGVSQYSEFGNHPWLNPGTTSGLGNFTIGCWINVPTIGSNISGIRVIMDKRTLSAGVRGYSLFLDGGYLGLQIADGAWTNHVAYLGTHQVLNDNQWHFVSAVVDRGAGVGTLSLDGIPWSFSTTSTTGSLSNTAPLRIGGPSAFGGPAQPFSGIIDEVFLSQAALSPAQLDAIRLAAPFGTTGMCKSQVVILGPTSFLAPSQVCQLAVARIYNHNVFGLTYTYNWQSLPASTWPCTINGPTQILPASGSIYVPPHGSADIQAVVNRPVGLGYACIQLQVTPAGNFPITATGSFWVDSTNLTNLASCVYYPRIVQAGVHQVGTGSFALGNEGSVAESVAYRIVVEDSSGNPETDAVSLNGLPPGTPIVGNLVIVPNETTNIPFSARLRKTPPLRDYSIVLYDDANPGNSRRLDWKPLRDELPSTLSTEVLTPDAGAVSVHIRGTLLTPGSTVLSFLTFTPGQFPYGWLGGLDLPLQELSNQFGLAALGVSPYALTVGSDSTASWSIPSGLPPGIPVWGVSVVMAPNGAPLEYGNLFELTTR